MNHKNNNPEVKKAHKPIFLLLGRITRWKGHELFIKVALRFPDYEFWVAGEANQEDQSWYSSIKAKSPENLKWLGFVDPYQTIRLVDAVVVCSLAPEPFGRTVIEALALGKSVIAPSEGGPAETLGEYGTIYNVYERFKPKLTFKKGWKVYRELSRRAVNRANSLAFAIQSFVDEKSIKIPSREYMEKFDVNIVCRGVWNVLVS